MRERVRERGETAHSVAVATVMCVLHPNEIRLFSFSLSFSPLACVFQSPYMTHKVLDRTTFIYEYVMIRVGVLTIKQRS